MAYPSKPMEVIWRALRPRICASVPPCTMPNTAWSGRERAAAARPAHAVVRSTARERVAGSAGRAGHQSSTIAMSDPSRSW